MSRSRSSIGRPLAGDRRLRHAVDRVLMEPIERRLLLTGLADLAVQPSQITFDRVPGLVGQAERVVEHRADDDLWFLSRQFDVPTLGLLDRVHTSLQKLLSRDLRNGEAALGRIADQRINGTPYNRLYLSDETRPHVQVYSNDAKAAERYLRGIGMEVTHTFSKRGWNLVGGYLPIDAMLKAASMPGLMAVRPSEVARPDGENVGVDGGGGDAQGNVVNQWEALTRADVWTAIRSADNGSGLQVGVISDTANRVGTGLAGSQAAGNLPAGVTILQDAASGIDEGRAMMELIHDVAPGAGLFFHSAFGVSGHAVAYDALRDAGVDIIADDIPNFSEPVFQQGPISIATEEVYTTSDVLSFLSAGNRNNEGYAAGWSNSDADRFHNFSGGDETLEFTLPNGGDQTIFLHWNQPWGATSTDIDIRVYLRNNDGSIGALQFESNQDNTPLGLPIGNSIETLSFTNTSGAARSYHVSFVVEDGNADGSNASGLQLQMYMPDSDNEITWLDPYTTNEPAINPNRNADNVFVLGAVPWNNPGVIEGFSSRGPITRYFTDGGAALGSPITLQYPNFTAADGTATGTPGFANFFGTSAASPNAAAVAALVLDVAGVSGRGDLTFTQMRNIFRDTAVGTNAGLAWDPAHGLGRIDALGAGFAAKGPSYKEIAVELNPFGDATITTGNLFGITDVDGFYFATDSSGNVVMTATDVTAALDPAIFLYDDSISGPSSWVDFDFDDGVGDDASMTTDLTALNLYTLEVFNQTLNTLSSDFNLTINGPSAFAASLSLNANGDASVPGNIQTDDADYYQFVAPATADGSVTITLTNAVTLDGVLTLYNSSGTQLSRNDTGVAGDTDTIVYNSLVPGQLYYIRVGSQGYETTGDFTLALNLGTVLPTNLPASGAESFLAISGFGVGVNSEFFNDANIQVAGDIDSYVFAGETSGTYNISVSRASGTVHPAIAVYDGDTGNLILTNINAGNATTVSFNFAGTGLTRYVVAIADNDATDTGDVSITVTTPVPIGSGGALVFLSSEGDGSATPSITDADTDFYRFTVPDNALGATNIRVIPTAASFDAAFMVFNATSNEVVSRYAAAAGVEELVSVSLTPGQEYYVSVLGRSYETTGSARLEIEHNLRRGNVAGTKIHDLDGDGVIDGGEPGLAGFQFYADLNGSGSYQSSFLSRSTDPDDFLSGVVMDNLVSGVGLTAIGGAVNGSNVSSLVDAAAASTGDQVYGYLSTPFASVVSLWSASSAEFQATFERGASSVSIDFISDDASDIGRLQAYSASNTLLATYTTSALASGVSETMTITRSQGDIAYIRAFGVGGDAGALDNLDWVLPEPTAVSVGGGAYSITGVPIGTWNVREVPVAGWTISAPAAGFYSVTLTINGQTLSGRNFLNYQDGVINGTKWEDLDGDGVIDGGESPLSGFIIYADLDNDSVRDVSEPFDVTDGAGAYALTLVPGNYRIREEVPFGWQQTAPVSGFYDVNATSGSSFVRNFGNRRLIDHGDAPNSFGTLIASNGPHHWLSVAVRLGNQIDAEPNGQPGVLASGDDSAGVDDEDGVLRLSPLLPGLFATLQVRNGGALLGRVNGWIDFDRSGTFDATERVLTNVAVAGGSTVNLPVSVPAGTAHGHVYARFRINLNGLASPLGLGFEGEVEDYLWAIGQPLIGDMNCDGLVNNLDIAPFVQALTNPAAYVTAFPNCDIMAGDVNNDGVVNNLDIAPFVTLLTGGRGTGDVRGLPPRGLFADAPAFDPSEGLFEDDEPLAGSRMTDAVLA